jgi:Raf kinase inhibitor-like YbhB/YbcL family protein
MAIWYFNSSNFTLKSNELGGQATDKASSQWLSVVRERIPHRNSFWENAPKDTKSFAVTIHDENAPTGSGWWHWVIFDIPSAITELKSGAGNINLKLAPANSIQSVTDFKAPGYGGPCPPEGHGPHKYTVTVYALKTEKLGLDATANPALVGFMLGQNLIQKASLVFYYNR